MNIGEFKVKIEAEVIARHKDWHHILMLMDGKFADVFIVDCSNID